MHVASLQVTADNPSEEPWQSPSNVFGLASPNLATERRSCAKTQRYGAQNHKTYSASDKHTDRLTHEQKQLHHGKHRWCCYITKPIACQHFHCDYYSGFSSPAKIVVNPAKYSQQDGTQTCSIFNCNYGWILGFLKWQRHVWICIPHVARCPRLRCCFIIADTELAGIQCRTKMSTRWTVAKA